MLGVHGNAMVILLATSTDVVPPAFLLLEVEASRVRKEKPGHEHPHETEPRDDIELLLRGNVIVHDCSSQGAELSNGRGEAVSGSTNGCWKDLSGDEEGDSVWTELIEE